MRAPTSEPQVRCPGCGLVLPDRGLPRPQRQCATGECAADAAPVLGAFYSAELFDRRQYAVDAYATQHPDPTTRRGIQATALSLMTMDLYFRCGQPVADGSRMHQEHMRSRPTFFVALDPPDLTVVPNHHHVVGPDPARLAATVEEWARAVWEAWAPHHAQIREWNLRTVPARVG